MKINELRVGSKYILKFAEISALWTYIGGVKNVSKQTLYQFKREDGKRSWFTIQEVEALKRYET